MSETQHRTKAFLEAHLDDIQSSPTDQGTLEMIVVRPEKKQRSTPEQCMLSEKLGVHGDHWAKGCWKSLPDGSPDPAVQVAIMNSRCLDLVAGSRDRWPLAGDNLIVDLDLGTENLSPGQRLAVGNAILEITSVPHNGCAHFKERYGVDALQFISTKTGKSRRLRGIYAKIVRDGTVKLGDSISKLAD
jgi:MOSC domain-containing protein YiiM